MGTDMSVSHYIATFFTSMPLRSFTKGQLILQPEDMPHGIYFIEKGHVKVYSLTEWGDEKLHIIFKPEELFPIFWIFDGVPLTKYYEAIDTLDLRIATKKEFLTFLKDNSEALYEMMNKVIKTLEVYSSRIDNLEFTNAYARLVSRLLYLAKRFGEHQENKIRLRVPLCHKDLAASVAMSRETASREFEKLEKKGIIGYEDHTIVIYNVKKLEKELSAHFDKRLL